MVVELKMNGGQAQLSADQIKVLLIEDFLSTREPDLVASELAFNQGFRKADLALFKSGKIWAYEIKSSRDKLDKLRGQMEDYTGVFSYCSLVTTRQHIAEARKRISQRVGLILVEGDSLRVVREPTENRRLSKWSMSNSMPGQFLQCSGSGTKSIMSAAERRVALVRDETLTSLQRSLYQSLFSKYERKYRMFLQDRGDRTTLTDLYYLQSS